MWKTAPGLLVQRTKSCEQRCCCLRGPETDLKCKTSRAPEFCCFCKFGFLLWVYSQQKRYFLASTLGPLIFGNSLPCSLIHDGGVLVDWAIILHLCWPSLLTSGCLYVKYFVRQRSTEDDVQHWALRCLPANHMLGPLPVLR